MADRDFNSVLLSLAGQQAKEFNSSPFSQAFNRDLRRTGSSLADAFLAPGNALQGQYNSVEVNPNGSVNPFNMQMMNAASNMAGAVSLGSAPMPRPRGSLGMGGRPKSLPSSETLFIPPAPSADAMMKAGRVETVPIQQARATNSMQWDRFNSGDHPPPIVKGFGDKPVAVRMENGEYLVFDGHHRTALAASNGAKALDMYVIDAKDYAPMSAGKKSSAAPKWSTADDDLLRDLGF